MRGPGNRPGNGVDALGSCLTDWSERCGRCRAGGRFEQGCRVEPRRGTHPVCRSAAGVRGIQTTPGTPPITFQDILGLQRGLPGLPAARLSPRFPMDPGGQEWSLQGNRRRPPPITPADCAEVEQKNSSPHSPRWIARCRVAAIQGWRPADRIAETGRLGGRPWDDRAGSGRNSRRESFGRFRVASNLFGCDSANSLDHPAARGSIVPAPC